MGYLQTTPYVMDTLKPIFICLEVLVLFNVLIFVHELGHFLAARWRGLKVERFAIWFGKPIWSHKLGDVWSCPRTAVPAGGYVSLPNGSHGHAGGDRGQSRLLFLVHADKIIVAFAGPLFSFLLAFAFAAIVWQIGRPLHEAETTTCGRLCGQGWTCRQGWACSRGQVPGGRQQACEPSLGEWEQCDVAGGSQ